MNNEESDQKTIIEWAMWHHINDFDLFHVPNGGFRNKREAARFKQLGVRPGICDLISLVPRHGYHGLLIELKRKPDGKTKPYPTKEQAAFLERKAHQGYKCAVAYGADEAIRIIDGYFKDD